MIWSAIDFFQITSKPFARSETKPKSKKMFHVEKFHTI